MLIYFKEEKWLSARFFSEISVEFYQINEKSINVLLYYHNCANNKMNLTQAFIYGNSITSCHVIRFFGDLFRFRRFRNFSQTDFWF